MIPNHFNPKSEMKKSKNTNTAAFASDSGSNNSGGGSPVRVMLAEDHTVVRDGVAAIINQESDMTVVALARDGRDAVGLWKKHRPDVTIMDLRMPGLDGVSAIYEIRA